MSRTYPDKLEIRPLTKAPDATIRVPGSKSITNRALVLAALSPMDVSVHLENALRCDDSEVMLDCLHELGYRIIPDWKNNRIHLPYEERRRVPATSAELFVGNSGTTMRFLTAMVATGEGTFRLDGVPRMRERPIQDLIDALNQFPNVNARCERGNGCPPVIVETQGIAGGHIKVRAGASSQFLSGLLLAAPFADGEVVIDTEGPVVSEPYIAMTLSMIRDWDREVVVEGSRYTFPNIVSTHSPSRYVIESDASAASYPLGAAAVAGGRVTVPGVRHNGLQGDAAFAAVLDNMGCTVTWTSEGVNVAGGELRGINIDMNAISDTVMTLAAVACFAEGPTTIRNVAHVRHKETDRIAAVATELRRLGADVEEFPDGLLITPRPLHGAEVETYNDHRMAMSLALIGLRVPGVVIKNPGCVTKTYPGFWDDFAKLYD